LDIEGSEYEVLGKLIFSGALCSSITSAFIEEHPWALADIRRDNPGMHLVGIRQVEQYLEEAGRTAYGSCPFRIWKLDDESYLKDAADLPSGYGEPAQSATRQAPSHRVLDSRTRGREGGREGGREPPFYLLIYMCAAGLICSVAAVLACLACDAHLR
jgi:hypothetical protein